MSMTKTQWNEYRAYEDAVYEAITPEIMDSLYSACDYVDEMVTLAKTHGRLQEASCNGELSKWQASRERNIEARITTICDMLGIRVRFSGDPRGHTVKLILPNGKYNSWDGETWGVPQ